MYTNSRYKIYHPFEKQTAVRKIRKSKTEVVVRNRSDNSISLSLVPFFKSKSKLYIIYTAFHGRSLFTEQIISQIILKQN